MFCLRQNLFVLHRHLSTRSYSGQLKSFSCSQEALPYGTRSTEQKSGSKFCSKHSVRISCFRSTSICKDSQWIKRQPFQFSVRIIIWQSVESKNSIGDKTLNRKQKYESEVFCLGLNFQYCLDFHKILVTVNEINDFSLYVLPYGGR